MVSIDFARFVWDSNQIWCGQSFVLNACVFSCNQLNQLSCYQELIGTMLTKSHKIAIQWKYFWQECTHTHARLTPWLHVQFNLVGCGFGVWASERALVCWVLYSRFCHSSDWLLWNGSFNYGSCYVQNWPKMTMSYYSRESLNVNWSRSDVYIVTYQPRWLYSWCVCMRVHSIVYVICIVWCGYAQDKIALHERESTKHGNNCVR